MVPRKVRTFWRTVQICWEFWAQSLFLCSAQRRKQTQSCRTWLLAQSICSSPCLSQPLRALSEKVKLLRDLCGGVAWGHPQCWVVQRAKFESGLQRYLLIAEIFPAQIQPLMPSTPLAWSTGNPRSSHTFSMASALCPSKGHICAACFPCWMPKSGSL